MKENSVFNKFSKEYDLWYKKQPGSLIIESEVKALKSLSIKGVGIEVGVGTGVFSERLGTSIGIDPSLEMLKIAKTRGINVINGIGESLPIKNECLDYVLYIFTISFLKNIKSSIIEARRVLKPEGSIVIGFLSLTSKWGEFYLQKQREEHRFYKNARFYTKKEVEEILKQFRFTISKISATLTQPPRNFTKIEEPTSKIENQGFICIKAEKKFNVNSN